ncbi:MAG: class D sortase [Candidatus Eisenbacteria bacterium]|uniref:Class D sortase n=1 Tax=Eiseniibacteriota bacterium TaxID=2212470 RepID=A0A538UAE6_UNCEI|nr:MAG: class D sortase [Candidatus Eisenbacteria bacterium]
MGRGLFFIGAALLAISFGVYLEAHHIQDRLSRRLEALHAPGRAPAHLHRAEATRREARLSGLIGRLEIQRLGLSVMVVEGTSFHTLQRGVGHVTGTAYPGERGNVGLAGHRDTYFRSLAKIRPGDRIFLRTPDGRFTYEVEKALIVSPERGDLMRSVQRSRLTLVTCYPFYFIGPAPRRFVVLAHPVDSAGRLVDASSARARAARKSAKRERRGSIAVATTFP